MKILLAAGLCAMSIAAIADTITFICTDLHGRKSIQDRICDGSAASVEARNTVTNPPKNFGMDNWVAGQQSKMQSARCDQLRAARKSLMMSGARELNQGASSWYREQRIKTDQTISSECAGP